MAFDQPTATLIAGIVAAVGSTTVGVCAIVFAWRNMQATLRQQRAMASDDRRWEQQRALYQELAEWLAGHHLAGADDPLVEPDVLASFTADPGQELEAKARLFAGDRVVDALSRLRKKAYEEDKITQMFRYAMTSSGGFASSIFAETMHWENANEPQALLVVSGHQRAVVWQLLRFGRRFFQRLSTQR